MPFLTADEVVRFGIDTDIPNEPQFYLYDMMTEHWIFIGRSSSPTSVIYLDSEDSY
tara:strand:+ start:1564 stop:1731 length:168 start_codon:yes stop_codon:yes gene_type:complete